jgi:hypothetical protein
MTSDKGMKNNGRVTCVRSEDPTQHYGEDPTQQRKSYCEFYEILFILEIIIS